MIRNRRFWTVIATAFLAALSMGFPGDELPVDKPEPAFMPQVEQPPLASITQSVVWAARDLFPMQHTADVHYLRYLFVQRASPFQRRAGSLNLNFLSVSGDPYIPDSTATGFLLRTDVRYLTNDDFAATKRFLEVWEELRFDPAYRENLLDGEDGVVSSEPSYEVPKAEWEFLCRTLRTSAPIVSLPYFTFRSLTTIQGQLGNETIYSGLYYKFLGIGEKLNEIQDFFGIGDGKSGLDAFYRRLPSLRIAAVRKRGLTGKKSRILAAPLESRFSGWMAITEDPEDGKDGGVFDPLINLEPFPDGFGFRPFAKEAFFSLPNKLTIGVLYNGNDVRQDVAPPQVAKSRTYFDRFGNENPHAAQLQPLIQCLECHMAASPELDGWRPVGNTVKSYANAGLFPVHDKIRLRTLYSGVEDTFITRARDDLHEGVLRSIVDWPGGDNRRAVSLATREIYKTYVEYAYEPIDAQRALWELGIPASNDAKEAVKLFAKLVPKVRFENDVVHDLREGGYVNRFDWDQVRSSVARRIGR